MTDTNKDLLFRTMDRVLEVAPEGTWRQGTWLDYDGGLCGTTACFAGWVLQLEGGVVRLEHMTNGYGHPYIEATGLDMPDGTFVSVDDIADEAHTRLRITWGEAKQLFYSENSLTQLKEIVDHIAGGERNG